MKVDVEWLIGIVGLECDPDVRVTGRNLENIRLKSWVAGGVGTRSFRVVREGSLGHSPGEKMGGGISRVGLGLMGGGPSVEVGVVVVAILGKRIATTKYLRAARYESVGSFRLHSQYGLWFNIGKITQAQNWAGPAEME